MLIDEYIWEKMDSGKGEGVLKQTHTRDAIAPSFQPQFLYGSASAHPLLTRIRSCASSLHNENHKRREQLMDEQQKPPSQPDPAQQPDTSKGEEKLTNQGNNAGRQETGNTSDTNRPSGTATSKDSTGVNPKDPVDPESPHIPAP